MVGCLCDVLTFSNANNVGQKPLLKPIQRYRNAYKQRRKQYVVYVVETISPDPDLAGSAVTFLLRVRSAARAEKCKWEVAGEGVYLSTVVGLASSSSALHVTFAHISPIRSRKIPETTQRADREERR